MEREQRKRSSVGLVGMIVILLSIVAGSCSKHSEESQISEISESAIETIFAGGLNLTVISKDSNYIRLKSDSVLEKFRLKAVISDLMDDYDAIYFLTDEHNGVGEEYASWVGNKFFDFENEAIIPKNTFFKNTDNSKELKKEKKRKKEKITSCLQGIIEKRFYCNVDFI